MAYELPDNVKGIQPVNEATSVSSLNYPFSFIGYGASAGNSAPLVSYSSADLRSDILKLIAQVVGGSAAQAAVAMADEPAALSEESPQMVSAETFFGSLSESTKQALAVIEFNGTDAVVSSAVNSELRAGELPISVLKQGNKSYIRVHTPISKSKVVDGSLSLVVESENPTAGEFTILWREDDDTELLDITLRNYPCKVHVSYLTPLLGGKVE